MRRLIIAAAAAALLAAAGCSTTTSGTPVTGSSGATGTSPHTPTIVPPSSPATTPPAPTTGSTGATSAEWSRAVAGKMYLAYTAGFNAAIKVLDELYNTDDRQLGSWHAACHTLATADTQFYDSVRSALEADRWPASARGAVAGLVKALPQDIGLFTSCAQAGTVASAKAVLARKSGVSAAAKAVRKALGLPPPPK